jgi:hypothetical protein
MYTIFIKSLKTLVTIPCYGSLRGREGETMLCGGRKVEQEDPPPFISKNTAMRLCHRIDEYVTYSLHL